MSFRRFSSIEMTNKPIVCENKHKFPGYQWGETEKGLLKILGYMHWALFRQIPVS